MDTTIKYRNSSNSKMKNKIKLTKKQEEELIEYAKMYGKSNELIVMQIVKNGKVYNFYIVCKMKKNEI